MQLVRVTAPEPILTVAEVKKHLTVEHSDHDWLIDAYLQASIDFVDGPNGFLGRALGPQTWDMTLDYDEFVGSHPCDSRLSRKLEIPLAPLIDVDEIEYRNSAGSLTAFTTYDVFGANAAGPAYIRPDANTYWPSLSDTGDAIRVRFQCGYAVSNGESPDVLVEAVPWPIKAAILLHVGDLYRNRETVVLGQTVEQLPWAAEQLLRPHRVYLSLA